MPEECEESDTYESTESDEPWIGVLEIPATEYLNSYGSRSCSVLDRVTGFPTISIYSLER